MYCPFSVSFLSLYYFCYKSNENLKYVFSLQQVEKISKQMQLEAQLADAKLAKLKMEMTAEKEILLREKQQLLMVCSKIIIYLEHQFVP